MSPRGSALAGYQKRRPGGRPGYDVAVVGGGPAGCSAALTLARHGVRAVLFEAGTYPHDKLCGEFLSPEGADLLERLGVRERFRALNPVPINEVRISAPDGTAWQTRLPGAAWGISRRALDAALAAHAVEQGVTLREGTVVTGLEGDLQRGFRLETRGPEGRGAVSARLVIGAYGKRGRLDRVLERPFFRREQPFLALKAHFDGPPVPGRVELHAFRGGYCGVSEIEGDSRVVCLLVHAPVFRAAAGQGRGAEGFVAWMQGQNGRLRSWLGRAERLHERWISIAQVPFQRKRVVAGDVLMAGDAAGLIVPLAGDGICMALEGGMLAAEHCAAFLTDSGSPERLRAGYARAWRGRFRRRLWLGRALQPLMLHPRALALALRLLSSAPSLGDFLVRQTRGQPMQGA